MATATDLVDEPIRTLIDLAASGDDLAFARIVRAHHDDMARVCHVICGDLDLADEAVQSAWPIAWRRLSTLRDPSRLRPWLIAIAVNEARQVLRRRRRRPVIALDVVDAEVGFVADTAERIPDLDLRNALARLSTDDRALLAWRYVAGFDATEIARATGRSPSGTRTRLFRLLRSLRLELSDDER
jgi:RNA polymerase sigma-70 factor (ECF subfamily)